MSSPTDADRSAGGFASLFYATMFPQTVVSMLSSTPPVMIRDIAVAFDLPVTVAGTYAGLLYGLVFVGTALSPMWIARWAPLRLSFACVAVAGAALAAFASGALAAAFIGTMILGLSYGPLTPASAQVIARQPRTRAFTLVMSIRQTSVPLGAALAGLVVPSLVLHLGWQAACWLLGLASAIASAVSAFGLRQVRDERPPGSRGRRPGLREPLRLTVRNKALLSLALSSVAFGAVQLILSAFTVAYLTTVVGHTTVTAGLMLGASQVAGVVGRIGWGMAADRMRVPRRLLAVIGVGMAAACLSMAALSFVGPTALTLPVALLFGATATGWNGVFIAEVVREVEPAAAGLATSGSLMFCYGGIIVGPPAFGALGAVAGLPAAYLATALLSLIGAFLIRPGAGN